MTDPTAGPIRLGFHGSPLVATRLLRAAGWPLDEAVLREYDITDPFRGLRAGGLDLMIVKFGLREPDLACSEVLDHDGRAVVLAAGHPLAGRESVSVEELAAYDAFHRPGELPDYVWDQVVPPRTPAGLPIRRRHRATSIPEMLALVTAAGAVHLSLESLRDVAPPGIAVVPIHDLPPAPVALAWRRRPEPPPRVRALVAAAEAGRAAR